MELQLIAIESKGNLYCVLSSIGIYVCVWGGVTSGPAHPTAGSRACVGAGCRPADPGAPVCEELRRNKVEFMSCKRISQVL